MPYSPVRYAYDPTGTNPDNLVVNETHILATSPTRSVSPIYGAFFTESVKVFDDVTDALLTKNVQYVCVELLKEPTEHLGKELCALILILDRTVNSSVRINYQVLGGHYQNQVDNMVKLYNAVIKDARPVNFSEIINKPNFYPPTLHQHILDDIYGFGPVVNALERIRQAILMTSIPAFEALIDYINKRLDDLKGGYADIDLATYADIDSGIPNNKVISTDTLFYTLAMQCKLPCEIPFYTIKPKYATTCSRPFHYVMYIDIVSKHSTYGPLTWRVEHVNTDNVDFDNIEGDIDYRQDNCTFQVIITNKDAFINGAFKIQLYREIDIGSNEKVRISVSNLTIHMKDYLSPQSVNALLNEDYDVMRTNNILSAKVLFFDLKDKIRK
jgi:hypothetical protein